MESLWNRMTSDDEAEMMMVAIANNMIDGVQAQMSKGITGATQGESVARGPGKISMFGFACERGNLEAARLLYSPELDLEKTDDSNMTPLMNACQALDPPTDADYNPIPYDANYLHKCEELIILLVELGANVNAIRESDHMTVLHWAAHGCSEKIITLLIKNGAHIDWPDDDQSALITAARSNNAEAVKALVENGAQLNRPCLIGWAENRTALGVAVMEHQQGYNRQDAIDYLRNVDAKEYP